MKQITPKQIVNMLANKNYVDCDLNGLSVRIFTESGLKRFLDERDSEGRENGKRFVENLKK